MDTYEPTPEEKKNGWTPESLEAYHKDRDSSLNPTGEDAFIQDMMKMQSKLPTYQVRKHPFKR